MVSVTYGASYGPLPDPVRLDYAFAGWYLDQGGTKLRVTEDTQVTIGRDHTSTPSGPQPLTPMITKLT